MKISGNVVIVYEQEMMQYVIKDANTVYYTMLLLQLWDNWPFNLYI